ncbi:MAG: copper resistance protein CopC [Candidatus Rokubacteria bacterium]|nr:copper resistance protein CopC [Candidatus Rokubacteria bacterium]
MTRRTRAVVRRAHGGTTLVAVLALLIALVGATGGAAHALIERTDPRAGSALRTPPREVRLWFTEALEPAWSRLEVVGEDGRRVDRGDGRIDRSAPKLFRLSLQPLLPGAYTVRWRVVSVDSHVSEGRFTFRVAP